MVAGKVPPLFLAAFIVSVSEVAAHLSAHSISRMPAGKVTLAARADAYQNSGDGSVGQKFRDEIEMRSAKLSEPPPPKDVRPLAVPHRVGGRAVRCERRLFTRRAELRAGAARV